MSTPSGASSGHPIDPFLLPSPTIYRFVLLVLLVASVSCIFFTIVHNSMPSNWEPRMALFAVCEKIENPIGPTGLPDVDAGGLAREVCMAPANLRQGAWIAAGLLLLFGAAFALYWATPIWKLRRGQLEPLSHEDAPEVLAALGELVAVAGLSRQPHFVWSPTNPAISGLAFGRLGRYHVALSGGLVSRFYTDPAQFRAIVLHELAHLHNRDVDRTYFTVAIWYAFLLVALVPFLATRFIVPSEHLFAVSWRLLALTSLVLLTRNEVLRTREHYADLRALAWDGDASALPRLFESQRPPAPQASWRTRVRALLDFHPSFAQRLALLRDSTPLFRPDFTLALATGATATIGIHSGSVLVNDVVAVRFSGWFERLDAGTLLVCVLFGTLSAYVIGSDLWESELLAVVRGAGPSGGLRAGSGLGLGIVLGFWIDMTSAATSEVLGISALGLIGWIAAVLLVCCVATKGFADGVHAWLRLGGRRTQLSFARSLSVASYALLLCLWLTTLSYAQPSLLASEQVLQTTVSDPPSTELLGPLMPLLPLLLTGFTLVTGLTPTLTMVVLGIVPFLVAFGTAPQARPSETVAGRTDSPASAQVRPLRALALGVAAGLLPLLIPYALDGKLGVMRAVGATGVSATLVLAACATAALVARASKLLGWLHALTCGLGAGAVTWIAVAVLSGIVGANVDARYQVGPSFNLLGWLALSAGLLGARRPKQASVAVQ
jgi:Zn-dependent protease with chaperone function